MFQTRSSVALCIVVVILVTGLAGWFLDNEVLQAAFIVIPMVALGIGFRMGKAQNLSNFLGLIYSKKEFDRVQSSAKTWTHKNYLMYYFGYGTVALLGGLGFLYLYSISGSITALLFGLGFTPSGLSSILMGSVFRESDLHSDPKKKAMTVKYARGCLMATPIIVILGMYVLPPSSIFQGELVMMNMFGLLYALIGIASLPVALWRVMSSFRRQQST